MKGAIQYENLTSAPSLVYKPEYELDVQFVSMSG